MTARRAWSKRVWAVVLALAALQATSICVHAGDAQTQPETPKSAVTVSLLPDRTLLRIGVEDLRTPNWINDIAFSPDGETVAAAVADTTVPRVVFFHVRTGRQLDVLTPPARPVGAVQSLAYSPDGSKLVWGESSGHVALWDLPTHRLVFREKFHESSVYEVQFSPNGSMLASAGDVDVVRIGRAGNPGALVRQFVGGEPSPDRVRFPDLPGAFPAGPFRLAFTPNGDRLVVGSGSRSISVWRIEDGRLLRQINNAHGIRQGCDRAGLQYVSVTADGRRILSAGGSRVPIALTIAGSGPQHERYSEVRIWDMETGALIKNLHGEENHGFGYSALSTDGKHLALCDLGVLRILATETNEPEIKFALPGCPGYPPAFSRDGAVVAMPILNSLAFFDVRAGRRLHHVEGMPEGELIAASWSPSGDRIVTGHGDGGVRYGTPGRDDSSGIRSSVST